MTRETAEKIPGIGSLVIGYSLLGLQPLAVALLAQQGLDAGDSMFARFLFSAVVLAGVVLYRRKGLRSEQPLILVLRGLTGAFAVILYFHSVHTIGAARGTILNYTYPIWANVYALFLGARPSKRFWISLLFAWTGVLLLLFPGSGWELGRPGAGELAGLGSALLAGAAVVTIKKLRRTDESLTILGAFTFFGLVVSAPFVRPESLLQTAQSLPGIGGLLSVGILAFMGHLFFTNGYRGTSLQTATLLSFLVPGVAATAGIALLDEEVGPPFFTGSFLILLALPLGISAAPPKAA